MTDSLSRRKRRQLKLAEVQREDDLRKLLSVDWGRRFVADLLLKCSVGRNVFTGNSQGFFLQGQQSIGNGLSAELKSVALEQFHLMEVEQACAQQRIADEGEGEPE
jgi:hypothetical protein